MKAIQKLNVAIMLRDSNREPVGHINGQPYNWTWQLIVAHAGDGYYWFTGSWSNRKTRKGPFLTPEAAVDDAYITLEGIR